MKARRAISAWGACSAIRIPKRDLSISGFDLGTVLQIHTEPGCIVLTRDGASHKESQRVNETDVALSLAIKNLRRAGDYMRLSIDRGYSLLERCDQKDIFS